MPTLLEVRAETGPHIFISEEHGIQAFADPYPKFPLQAVIAPLEGTVDTESHFCELPPDIQAKMIILSSLIGQKTLKLPTLEEIVPRIKGQNTPEQDQAVRIITHIEGYAIRDHAHIVQFPARRKQGGALYVPSESPNLGDATQAHELLRFNLPETELVVATLEQTLAISRS